MRSLRSVADGGTARQAKPSHRPTSRRFRHAHHAAVRRPTGKSFHNHEINRSTSFPARWNVSTRDRGTANPFGRKVILPARTVERIDPDDRVVFVDRTKEEIKNSSEFDPVRGFDPAYQDSFGDYCGR